MLDRYVDSYGMLTEESQSGTARHIEDCLWRTGLAAIAYYGRPEGNKFISSLCHQIFIDEHGNYNEDAKRIYPQRHPEVLSRRKPTQKEASNGMRFDPCSRDQLIPAILAFKMYKKFDLLRKLDMKLPFRFSGVSWRDGWHREPMFNQALRSSYENYIGFDWLGLASNLSWFWADKPFGKRTEGFILNLHAIQLRCLNENKAKNSWEMFNRGIKNLYKYSAEYHVGNMFFRALQGAIYTEDIINEIKPWTDFIWQRRAEEVEDNSWLRPTELSERSIFLEREVLRGLRLFNLEDA